VEVLSKARKWELEQLPKLDEKEREDVLREASQEAHRQWLETLPEELRKRHGG
jgi:hypothetical protein